MAFDAILMNDGDVATITLSGELDASSAPVFKEKVEEAAKNNPKTLKLQMAALDYMASAGLRVLIFSKQKMGQGVDIHVIEPQEMVLDTIKKTGFDQSVILELN